CTQAHTHTHTHGERHSQHPLLRLGKLRGFKRSTSNLSPDSPLPQQSLVCESLTHLFTHSLIHSLTHTLTHLFTHSLTHSLIHSLTHLFTHSLTHSLIL